MSKPQPTKAASDSLPTGPFRDLVAKIIRVPKEVVNKREAEYQREQAKKPKRGPKPTACGRRNLSNLALFTTGVTTFNGGGSTTSYRSL